MEEEEEEEEEGGPRDVSTTEEALLSEAATVAWRDVTYRVGPKLILDGVSGQIAAGEVLAIIGPSGSGKTSLLNAIAGRVPYEKRARLEGTVEYSGSYNLAYVTQNSALFALSTVRETLEFVARLRLDAVDREERVMQVVHELNLVECLDTVVGGSATVEKRGISGGERKRTHIGCELLHRPRFCFLDEPSSGLDSFQALSLVQTLLDLARGQRVVIASMHQPRSAIYKSLDALCVLGAGGRVAFFGTQETAAIHFSDAGFAIPPNYNPADWMLDVVSLDFRDPSKLAASRAAVAAVCDLHAHQWVPMVSKHKPAQEEKKKQDNWIAFRLLAARCWRERTRDKAALCFRWSMNTFFSFMFGLVYFQLGNNQTSIQNRQGILFFVAMNVAFAGPIGVSQIIPAQLAVINAERASQLYSEAAYLAATFVVGLPLECVPSLVSSSVVYFMVELRPGLDHFLVFAGLLVLEEIVGEGLGLCLSVTLERPEMAGQVAPAVTVLFVMFSGYFLNESSIPVYVRWLKYISFVRYTFQALAVNEFRGESFSCGDVSEDQSCVRKGGLVLEALNFDDVSIPLNAVILSIMVLGFNSLALIIFRFNAPAFLKFTTHPEQPSS
ncbi:hypothetical protein CTAYLR_001713 [Chrysophaeum taylorii]|uniref:ABC transporter domain-containing protein n=1 Tax=Chrysophaeum taylorii TaxID=2483200 RepID=A0AAD7U5S7_9STRA|nr:hypothetical protein CTAYLR_001713 [Chrysophaeum taylorii]